jgi:hypothetical protein
VRHYIRPEMMRDYLTLRVNGLTSAIKAIGYDLEKLKGKPFRIGPQHPGPPFNGFPAIGERNADGDHIALVDLVCRQGHHERTTHADVFQRSGKGFTSKGEDNIAAVVFAFIASSELTGPHLGALPFAIDPNTAHFDEAKGIPNVLATSGFNWIEKLNYTEKLLHLSVFAGKLAAAARFNRVRDTAPECRNGPPS